MLNKPVVIDDLVQRLESYFKLEESKA
jgi:hypothetical protein